MSVDSLGESTAKETRGTPAGGSLDLLHRVALVGVVAGAVGSVGLMLVAGHPPLFLRILFVIWLLTPFVALLVADRLSKRWSVTTRVTLHCVMLVITLSSLAIYGYRVMRPPKSTGAFVFVVVPPASLLLMNIVVPLAAFISRRLSRRGAGP